LSRIRLIRLAGLLFSALLVSGGESAAAAGARVEAGDRDSSATLPTVSGSRIIDGGPSVAAPIDVPALPFESDHPYADDSDISWSYDHGAVSWSFQFAWIELQDGLDFVQILDADGNVLETITGSWPGGYTTTTIPTATGTVRLISDQAGTGDGFLVESARDSAASTTPGLSVAFIGDQGLTAGAQAVLSLIAAEGADMVLHQGDFDYLDDPAAWEAQIDSILGADFPYFASVGNNDLPAWTGYQTRLQDRVDRIPGATCSGAMGVKTVCRYGGLLFLLSGVGQIGTGHATFLGEELAATDAMWRVCSWHSNQTAMQIGSKANDVGWGVYEACRSGGAIVATAHEHSYSRTRTLVDMEQRTIDPLWPTASALRVAPGATFAFVSGLGGHSIRDQERCLPQTFPYGCRGEWGSIYSSNQDANHGALFCTFGVPGAPDRADCYFKDIDGDVPDSFIVTSENSPAGPPPPPPPPPTCGGLSREAESGVLSGTLQAFADGTASEGAAIRSLNGSGDGLGMARYCVTIAEAGDYQIDAVVKGLGGLSNSFWVAVDGGAEWLFDTDASSTWVSDPVSQRNGADPIVVNLDPGEHEVTFRVREDGTRLDRFDLTQIVTVCDGLSREAEDGQLSGTLHVFTDGTASDGAAIRSLEGSGGGLGLARFCVTVAEAGDYQIDAVVKGLGGLSDSFWVAVDGGSESLFDTNASGNWVSDPVSQRNGADPVVFTLETGEHEVSFRVREDGTQLDRIALSLMAPPPPPPTPPPSACGGLSQEAESGVLSGTLHSFSNGAASGGAAIRSLNGSGDGLGLATYCVIVSEAGRYRVDTVIRGLGGLSNSFWVAVDGGPEWLFDTNASSAWVADSVSQRNGADPVLVDLATGEHELTFRVREDGTQLDRIVLTLAAPPCGGLAHEAEDGQLSGTLQVFADGTASGGAAIRSLEGSGNGLGVAQFCVTVTQAGSYRIDTVLKGLGGLSNSFWVSVDGGPERLFDTNASGSWVADSVSQRGGADPVLFNLGVGEHEVRFRVREDGTQLDRITLTPVG